MIRPHPDQSAYFDGQTCFFQTFAPRGLLDGFIDLHKPGWQTPQALARIFAAQNERDFPIRAFRDHARGYRWIEIDDEPAHRAHGTRMVFFDLALDERVSTPFAKFWFHDNSPNLAKADLNLRKVVAL